MTLQDFVAAATVAGAVVYLVRTLVFPKVAPSKKPDVPLSRLARRRRQ